MRLIFAGTPEFAVPCLQTLLNSHHEICAVYTQPDRPKGRGQQVQASPVKQLALAHHIHIHQPERLTRDEINILKTYKADAMIVVAYGLLLPDFILTIPQYGCINVHASLLPRWRGAAPIQHAILAGDKETGISIMQMETGLDTGPVYYQMHYLINPHETNASLHHALSEMGAQSLLHALNLIEEKNIKPQPQNNDLACYAKKINKQDALINWAYPATTIERMIRAYNPWPIAYTEFNHQHIRWWEAYVMEEETQHHSPGTIIRIHAEGIDITCGKGTLRILSFQLPGQRAMKIKDYLNGHAGNFLDVGICFND